MAQVPPAELNSFRKDFFSKEVQGWLGRATPADRDRFERVFESIRSISESQKAPDAHADFINSTLDKMKRRGSSAAAGISGRPPLAPGGSSTVANGWSYTATRAALGRPETASTMASLAEKLAEEQAAAAAAMAAAAERERERERGERPHSAPSNGRGATASPGSAAGRDRELSSFDKAAARRRAISFASPPTASPSESVAGGGHGKDTAAADAAVAAYQQQQQRQQQLARGATAAGGGGVAFVGISPDATNYQESYNLRSLYPDVYDQALRDTRTDAVPNYTLISEWGDSLKAGACDAQLRGTYMRTHYNTVNDEVCKLETSTDKVREQEFFKWMQRQKTYYGDLLSKAKRQDLESVLAVASDEQKREILNALRQIHATVDPDQIRSHSQTVHCDMRGINDLDLEAKLKEFTKRKTMGGPHTELAMRKPGTAPAASRRPATAQLRHATVDLAFGAEGTVAAGAEPSSGALRPSKPRPATAGAAVGSGARTSSVPPPRRAYVTAGSEKETFKSKCPIQWAVGATAGPQLSTYIDSFGGGKYAAGRPRPDSALYKVEPIKYREVTCPIGAVNPHTAMAPARASYPVPESFLGPSANATFPMRRGETMYRTEFAPRDSADVTASLAVAAALTAQAGKALQKSTLPMGPKNGVNLVGPKDWTSEMTAEYVPYASNYVTLNADTRVSMKVMFNGPTASTGKVATLVDSTGRLVKY